MKKDIFISYCRKNGGLEMAERIKERLEYLGYTVFMDLHNIELSKEVPYELVSAIKSCKDVLLVLPPNIEDKDGNTSNALESKWIQYEISYALKFNKRIIPILMEGYEFPEEDFDIKLPEEFEEITDSFFDVRKKNGIRIKSEYFDDNLKQICKSLKSRRKWKRKRKILFIALLLGIIVITKFCYNFCLPLFSLVVMSEEENSDNKNDIQSWNMKYVITNKKGQLAGGKVIPSIRIGLKVVSKYEGWDYKYGFFDIELTDFYKDSYFFDDKNNTVSISETKADALAAFIYLMEEQLEKKDLYIDMYAIKVFLNIDYTDTFGLNHREYYESENNYDFIFTNWGENTNQDSNKELIRYCMDNKLIRVNKFDDALFSHQLLLDDGIIFEWNIRDDVKYINKHQDEILKTNVDDIMEGEYNNNLIDTPAKLSEEGGEVIENAAGFSIGYHIKHDTCTYSEDVAWHKKVKEYINELLR